MPSPKGAKASHVILETRTQSLWDVDYFTPRELERSLLRSPHRFSPASPNLPQFPIFPDRLSSVFLPWFRPVLTTEPMVWFSFLVFISCGRQRGVFCDEGDRMLSGGG